MRAARFLLLMGLALVAPARAVEMGEVAGTIVSAETGQPVPAASVMLVGTTIGVVADLDGRYRLSAPAGDYTLQVQSLGFKTELREKVTVRPGLTRREDIRMGPGEDVKLPAIEVEGKYDLIQPESSSSKRIIRGDDVRSIPVDDVLEAIKLVPGVVAAAGDLHFRGGRAGEVQLTLVRPRKASSRRSTARRSARTSGAAGALLNVRTSRIAPSTSASRRRARVLLVSSAARFTNTAACDESCSSAMRVVRSGSCARSKSAIHARPASVVASISSRIRRSSVTSASVAKKRGADQLDRADALLHQRDHPRLRVALDQRRVGRMKGVGGVADPRARLEREAVRLAQLRVGDVPRVGVVALRPGRRVEDD